MFTLSKIVFAVIRPGNLLLIVMLIGGALLWARYERRRRQGRSALTALALVLLVLATTPLSDYALIPLENRFPQPEALPSHIDGIIILGASVDEVLTIARGQVSLTPEASRLTEAVKLARAHPEARVVFSGGSGRLFPAEFTEARIAGRFLSEMGISSDRLVLEGQSRNTYENAVRSKMLAHPKPGEQWVLVTSAVHMPRAIGVFRAVGWPVIPYPVGYLTTGDYVWTFDFDLEGAIVELNYATKEWVGLIAYKLLGRTDSFFPGPDDQH